MHRSLAWITGLLILLAGVTLSLVLHDWQWFSRSGCLLVALGIWLTSAQILSHHRHLGLRKLNWHRHMPRWQACHDWAAGGQEPSVAQSLTRDEDTWEIESHGLVMLIIGTLVWGFGDLPGLF